MNIYVIKDKWKPVDGIILEENAMHAAISEKSLLVIAGPGAGKTELLAQRACYLLQTNSCRYPYRILAVSFKKDAATNLAERVEKRCGEDLSTRFKSMTFDAFARSIVDQFVNAIPSIYRPSKDYKIVNDSDLVKRLRQLELFSSDSAWEVTQYYNNLVKSLTYQKLPLEEGVGFNDGLISLWRVIAQGDSSFEPCLTFSMIGRLAELLINKNPFIKSAINATYSHVFLDEYQDTTSIQYELFRTCFYRSKAVMTAVGDDKQRIMKWAGALSDGFEKFISDFEANTTMLLMNHRSAPRLLQIQKTLYDRYFYLNEIAADIANNPKWNDSDGISKLHLFNDNNQEAEILSDVIKQLIDNGTNPREICILVKQTPEVYCKVLIEFLKDKNIDARNEGIYQDLLKDELVLILISMIQLAVEEKCPDSWLYLIKNFMLLRGMNGVEDTREYIDIENQIRAVLRGLKSELMGITVKEIFKDQINELILFLGVEQLKSAYPQHDNNDYLDFVKEQFIELIWKSYESSGNWHEALISFKGEKSVPIMTIHKSKGLEFDVIFFLGLEDGAFWNFDRQQEEDFCTFFVALSRAKKRVDFTYCGKRYNARNIIQSRTKIDEFYEILNKSNIVEVIDYSEKKE